MGAGSNDILFVFQIASREDSLILYGPNEDSDYDLLLQNTIESSLTRAFSLGRFKRKNDGKLGKIYCLCFR